MAQPSEGDVISVIHATNLEMAVRVPRPLLWNSRFDSTFLLARKLFHSTHSAVFSNSTGVGTLFVLISRLILDEPESDEEIFGPCSTQVLLCNFPGNGVVSSSFVFSRRSVVGKCVSPSNVSWNNRRTPASTEADSPILMIEDTHGSVCCFRSVFCILSIGSSATTEFGIQSHFSPRELTRPHS